MAKATLFICLFALVLFDPSSGSDGVNFRIVNTTSGPVKGYKSSRGDFFAFFGVPYATAPIGVHKFKAPLPAPTWTEPFEAVTEHIYCPQIKVPLHWAVTTQYQEDCLVANIFVPDTDKTNLPVVVYIHGGAYQMGSGNLVRPYNFINEVKDVIVVNFNYRLGVHGFLCLGTEDVPGNAGMKDQVAALRWVKQNIASFGGDAEDIALAGFSAGSSSVDLLALSDVTEGLFTKTIPESGVGNCVWSVQMEPLENAKAFAKQLNFSSDDVLALEEFYKNAPLDLLTSDSFSKRYDHTLMFVPCVERDVGQEMFLREAPDDILKKGDLKNLPTLIGFSDMEGLLRADLFNDWKSIMNEDFFKFLPADLQFKNEAEKQLVANELRRHYFGDKEINDETIEQYFNYLGDGMFAYPIIRNVRMQVEAGNENVYLYQFSYADDDIASTRLFPKVKRADHCDQTNAVLEKFGASVGAPVPRISEDYKKMISIMREVWSSFIKTGNPVSKASPVFPKGWPASSAKGSPYMELNLPTRLKETVLPETFELWDRIYKKYYKKPQPPPAVPRKRSEL